MRRPSRFSSFIFLAVLCLPFCSSRNLRAAQLQQAAAPASASTTSPEMVTIPGSSRSFLRMAGVSQKVSPPEVLPFLAHNIVSLGYTGENSNAKPTEFLKLLRRYLDQARELSALADKEGFIRVSNCQDAKPLLQVLGYELRDACSPMTSVLTHDPERAFLAIDSGFPVAELEETLRGGKPLAYRYSSFQVPVLFSRPAWINTDRGTGPDVLDSLIEDKNLAHLYWALSRMDYNTANALRLKLGLQKMVPYAAMLDFYGSHIIVESGHIVVPGGEPAEATWKSLVGANPESPSEFVSQLLNKDDGWLAAYFDSLSRLSSVQTAYFTQPTRLKTFYEALRGPDPQPTAVKGVFRPDPNLLILMTRLQFDASGQPAIPGGLDPWKENLRRKGGNSKIVKEWSKRSGRIQNPDQLVEALIGLSRADVDNNPLEIFLSLNEIDRDRSADQKLSPQTAKLLISKYPIFSDQYRVFSEFHTLDGTSITRFMAAADSIGQMKDGVLRADTLGMFQANLGLWQILARQNQIPVEKFNDSWQRVMEPFASVHSSVELFDAGRASLSHLEEAATGNAKLSQDQLLLLLAGPTQTSTAGQQERQDLANKLRTVMDDQRLVSVDTLFALNDGLKQMSQGTPGTDALLGLVGELRETDMPKPIFSQGERSEWAAGLFNNKHINLERQTDIAKLIKMPGTPQQLGAARGELAGFLRDSLVGLNYAFYEPPGAQMLHSNPLLVRSHDFSGVTFAEEGQEWKTSVLIGKGSPASGGAHLSGSLADLPYALARAEQNFVVPENVQALIWEEMVPSLLTSAVVPRWWNVSRNEMHAVTLYQLTGEELLSTSAHDPEVRKQVMSILADRFVPARYDQTDSALAAGQIDDVLGRVMPGETFYLAMEYRRRYAGQTAAWGKAGTELDGLARSSPDEASWARISQDFGIPHPVLTGSYSREFLEIQPFPSFTQYPSRLLAESWDSNNLYWARLADELNYPPVMLNTLVPELTRRMVEKIFASNFEDWPALLRAIDETAAEFRVGGIAALQTKSGRVRN
jgi:hypothetical protein